ncbi:hypothetical protein K439DRAFT_1623343 [Ramaria rubella]|nr:hypothetical protein K439DRAFT_1623343 [Ramaria rubella]
MDDLISVTCRLAQNFTSQGWATKEGASKSQIPLEDVLGVMYGSVDVFSQCTIAWEPVSAEEGDLDHPPGTSRPDARASATQGVVKPDRATANRAPGAPGKDEALWELVYFFDILENLAGAPRKETGDPRFTQQHLVATFMDLILFARGLVAPRARIPLRAYEALAPSLTVPRPVQFFQGIAEQGYMRQNVPYGIDFTRDIGVYGRLGTSQSWGKAQQGAWFVALCHDDPDQRLGLVCVHAGHLGPMQEFPVFSRFVSTIPVKECLCLCHLGHADNHFQSKMIDPTVFQLLRAAGFPTRTSLAADPGHSSRTPLQARLTPAPVLPWELADPNLPRHPLAHRTLPCVRAARQCRPGPLLACQPPRGGTVLPPPRTNRPFLSRAPCELPPPRHARSPLPACHLSKWARSASGGPPGEDAQAVHSSEPHPIAGGRPTPLFNTLDSALLHVVQHAARSGGLCPGERECVVARLRGMPAPPQGFLGVVAHLRSLADQRSLAPWDFDPQGDGILPWLLPWARVLIS